MEDSTDNTGSGGSISTFTMLVFLTSMITSFLYISFNQTKYTYTGEYTFVFKKLAIIFATISIGYLNTIFFPCIKKIPHGDTIYNGLSYVLESKIIQNLLKQISTLWLIIALALLPYGHTVINVETNDLNKERTDQLNNFYSVFYIIPYYLIFIIFSIIMVCFIISIGEVTKQPDNENIRELLESSYNGIQSTVGFYFKSVKE